MTDELADGQLTRRQWLYLGLAASAASGCASIDPGAGSNVERDGPAVEENERDGDDGWLPQSTPNPRPEAATHLIEGFTARTSVAPGETLEFLVSTDPERRYRIDVYRLGWYDGVGGRLATSVPSPDGDVQGTRQPRPTPDPETGRVACDWEVTDTLDVPSDWVSGLYLARFVLTSGENEGQSTAHPFVVRPGPDREASVLVQIPLATEQAYNGWGGKSLYDHSSDGTPANVVSHDRPYTGELTFHTNYAVHLLRFMESEGYDVAYACDLDVHRNPESLQEYDLAISAGHDEYWSRPQRVGFEDARDAGTNLAFLGANIAYWQVRYEDDGRTMVCYKETADEDPVQDERRTDLFRQVGLPECELLGVQGWGGGLYNFPDYAVRPEATEHPWMADTGFEAGDEVVGVVGPEWDWLRPDCDGPSEYDRFFHYEEGSSDLEISRPADADALAYTADSGATVFSAGTIAWPRAVDPDPDWRIGWPYTRIKEIKPSVTEPDERLQQFTRNALDDLVASSGASTSE